MSGTKPQLVESAPDPASSANFGGGDNGGREIEARLRAVEMDIREIKTEIKHVATKAWILGGVLVTLIGVAAIAATILAAAIRFFK